MFDLSVAGVVMAEKADRNGQGQRWSEVSSPFHRVPLTLCRGINCNNNKHPERDPDVKM